MSNSSIPWTATCWVSLSFTISRSLLKLMFIESAIPSNHLILFHPLLLLLSTFPSTRVFSNESAFCIRWPKYWSFSISPSNEYSGLISFRIDWFDLLAVQGTLKCLWQHHSSEAAILQCSAFFIIQLSHLHVTTGKNRALTIRTFVGKVIPLLFNRRWGNKSAFHLLIAQISEENVPTSAGHRHQPGTLRLIVQAPIKCLCCPPLTPASSTSQMEKETQEYCHDLPKVRWHQAGMAGIRSPSLCITHSSNKSTVSTHWLDQA